MEFVKIGKNYLIKNSNGRIITEKEKLELENKELIIKDIKSNECQGKTTQKIIKNKKKIKQIEKENEVFKKWLELTPEINETALENGDGADDTIKETDKSI